MRLRERYNPGDLVARHPVASLRAFLFVLLAVVWLLWF